MKNAFARTGQGLALALVVGGLPGLGCSYVEQEQGQRMQSQINELQGRSSRAEQESQALSEKVRKQSEELSKLLEEARRLTTNLADSSQKADKLQSDLMQTQGRYEDLQRALDGVQKSFTEYRASTETKLEQLTNAINTTKNPPLPETPDALFAEAQKKLDARQFNDARRLYDAFVNRYPQDPRAAKAQYNIGEAYFNESKYANAIGAFTKVVDNFPKSEEIESAMFKNGHAFFMLKYCSEAKTYFQELLRRYPKTKYKNEAGEQIKEITRQAKNKTACQS